MVLLNEDSDNEDDNDTIPPKKKLCAGGKKLTFDVEDIKKLSQSPDLKEAILKALLSQ